MGSFSISIREGKRKYKSTIRALPSLKDSVWLELSQFLRLISLRLSCDANESFC